MFSAGGDARADLDEPLGVQSTNVAHGAPDDVWQSVARWSGSVGPSSAGERRGGGSGPGHRQSFTSSQIALRIRIQTCCRSARPFRHRSRRYALSSLSSRMSTSAEMNLTFKGSSHHAENHSP